MMISFRQLGNAEIVITENNKDSRYKSKFLGKKVSCSKNKQN